MTATLQDLQGLWAGGVSTDVWDSEVALGSDLPCHRVDPDVFFAETPAEVEYAKALCADCPLQQACLAGALARREPWGVWGGQLLIAGEVVARKRPRGRPRKHPLPDPGSGPTPAQEQGVAA